MRPSKSVMFLVLFFLCIMINIATLIVSIEPYSSKFPFLAGLLVVVLYLAITISLFVVHVRILTERHISKLHLWFYILHH